jgi:ATP-dependent Lon protease
MPGKIIQSMKQAGTRNPVILLDEIDKMSSDFRGDPASALLEVLDPEQNCNFGDHYIEMTYDLSDVMFVTTANTLYTIPRPLLDRMEIISIPGYTEEEKLEIAKRHLLPKQLKNHGLPFEDVSVDDNAIMELIRLYTRESGVRSLERTLSTVCRKMARKIVQGAEKPIIIDAGAAVELMGPQQYRYGLAETEDKVGVSTGMVWTEVGGDILAIEVNVLKGKGGLMLTGKLGEVMKESAQAGFSYVRSRAVELGLDEMFHEKLDVHIHVPEGATPKEGPSAGITIATALVSALTGQAIRRDVAMTGEITLRGRVLPIGGLKEKVLAAHRAGIKTIIVPWDNKKDLEEIPANVREDLEFVPVKHMDEVLDVALVGGYHPKANFIAVNNNGCQLDAPYHN